MRRVAPLAARATAALALLLAMAGCGGADEDSEAQASPEKPPENGVCRVLTPEDVARPDNASPAVPCTEEHTAQTYLVGTLPERFADAEHDDEQLGAFAYRTCSARFMEFLGADQSMVMRSMLSWAWFRPSEEAWADGARWYRCDVVGGGEQTTAYAPLPEDAEGLLQGLPDEWMACVQGASVTGAPRVPCSQEHDWRAVSAIQVGEPDDPYPGDRVVEVTSRDFCSKWVGAWLEYPASYDFAYTWFHKAEWEAGNRRSVCWARTSE
ncbi:septum formation family protein [Nocardioides pantholopis]|uniref:septum formation family protein n=1 Tax=Nocardioides pantholopis TaxID=2483798 RepID=UPI001F14FB4D|nr:septum formation family protein [Nocardioides pantholopis]